MVLAAGDITIPGHEGYATEFVQLIARHSVPLLVVHGNNDGADAMTTFRRSGVSVHRRERTIGGVRFVGVGGDGSQAHDFELADGEHQALDPTGAVLLTHVPPPRLRYAPDTPDGLPGASSEVRPVPGDVAAVAPRAHVCGHIHQQEGVAFLGPTKVVKVRAAFWGSYAKLDLDTLRASFHRLPA